MVALREKLKDRGFEVLAFPCNQFGGQEPKPAAEVKAWAKAKFDADFPIFDKIDVKGPNEHPVFTFLKTCFPGEITWNFSDKFIVDHAGVPTSRMDKQSWEDIEKTIVDLLDRKDADAAGETEKPNL